MTQTNPNRPWSDAAAVRQLAHDIDPYKRSGPPSESKQYVAAEELRARAECTQPAAHHKLSDVERDALESASGPLVIGYLSGDDMQQMRIESALGSLAKCELYSSPDGLEDPQPVYAGAVTDTAPAAQGVADPLARPIFTDSELADWMMRHNLDSRDFTAMREAMEDAASMRPAAPAPAAQGDALPDIESAAKTLAACMDYPWEHMPEQGREGVRKHARAIIDAARASAKGQ